MGQQNSVPQVRYSQPVGEKPEGCSATMRHPVVADSELISTYDEKISSLQAGWVQSVHQNGNQICLAQRDANGVYQTSTYRQVDIIAREIGSGIINLGLATTLKEYKDYRLTMVSIYAKNRQEWLWVDIGCAYLYGMTVVPLYDTLGPENVSYCLNHSEVSVIFCSDPSVNSILSQKDTGKLRHIVALDPITESQRQGAKDKGLNIYSIDEVRAAGRKSIQPFNKLHEPNRESTFTFSFTSGTTGPPKAAMMSHGNFLSLVGQLNKMKDIKLTNEDVHLSYLPLPHVYDRAVCTTLLLLGGAIYFYSGDVTKLKQDLAEVRPTFFASVPRLYNKFYDAIMAGINNAGGIKKFLGNYAINTKIHYLKQSYYEHKLWDKLVFKKVRQDLFGGRVRFCLTASAPISQEVIDFFQIAMSCPMIEAYGQTESSGGSFNTSMNDPSSGHVGGPGPNTEFKLEDIPEMNYRSGDVDGLGNPMPRGEICIRGPGVFQGYYKDDAKTKEAIDSEGWLHSGDVGVIDYQTGALKIIDRKKNIFKLSQGEYVAPEKIESFYLKAKGVTEVFVYGDSLQSHLVSVVVPDQAYVEKLGQELGISGDFQTLCQNKAVRKQINQNMFTQGKENKLYGFEQAKNVYLETKPFAEHKVITNTMKLQRHQAKLTFENQLKQLYAEDQLI